MTVEEKEAFDFLRTLLRQGREVYDRENLREAFLIEMEEVKHLCERDRRLE